MRLHNSRLVALVAAVAVAAIAIGGALAYRQGPQTAAADAAPLVDNTPSPTATPSPTETPSTATPSTTPKPAPSVSPKTPTTKPSQTATKTGPVKVTVNVSKLSPGREPAIPYLVGREIRGGSGDSIKVPGTGGILTIGRFDVGAMAVVATGGSGTELLKIHNGEVRRTPGVTSLVTTADQSSAAYAAARISSLGAATKGGVLYAETVSAPVTSLKLPDSWNLQVLAYADGKVYFRSDTDNTGAWKLYSWVPGATNAIVIKTVASPSAVSADGRIAASVSLINDRGSCSSVVEVATGKQYARSCDYMITGFTPDGGTAVGGPAYGDGYCNLVQAAVGQTGNVMREWNGCFHQIVAEDDQHVLIVAVAQGGGGDPGTKSAIIRCNLTSSDCELATPITTDQLLELGR
jgi:hypothetical protein